MNHLLVLLALIACSTGISAAQRPSSDALNALFSDFHGGNTPGCAARVSIAGADAWSGAWGSADLEHDVPITPTTVFEVGSISKQFTAAAVLLLAERQQLSLQDDVGKFFPELPSYKRPVTVAELLNHTSGLRDWGDIEAVVGWPRTTRVYTQAQVLQILERQRSLNYAPGEAWSYTNSGYTLAAMLVERVTGTSLQTFMHKEFFVPLSMTSTQWRDNFREVVPHRAIAYTRRGNTWQQQMPFENTYGHGGLLTTAGDLLKWDNAMLQGKFHPEIFKAMQQPTALASGNEVRYGFGLTLPTLAGQPEISHFGATAAYRAWLGAFPSKQLAIAVLCNADSTAPLDYGRALAGLYLGVSGAPVYTKEPPNFVAGLYRNEQHHEAVQVGSHNGYLTFNGERIRLQTRFSGKTMHVFDITSGEEVYERVASWTPADLREFEGSYVSTEADTTFTLVSVEGKLKLRRPLAPELTLQPVYEDSFASVAGTLRFLRDGKGQVTGIALSGPRVWDLRLERISKGKDSTP